MSNNSESEKMNTTITLESIHQLESTEEIIDNINTILPEWILDYANKFAQEYDKLNDNWDELCNKVKTEKRKILIVPYLPLENKTDNDKYINSVANMLTSKGFLLRRSVEIFKCPRTNNALLTRQMYDYFKKYNNIMPPEWCAESSAESSADLSADL